MATICVQIGQAGNQLGAQLFSTAAEDPASYPTLFRDRDGKPPVARAVLLDSEQKVVQAALSAAQNFAYEERNVHVRAAGAANNWALGYQHGALFQRATEEAMRRELEAADCLGAVLLLHSVAGGTGSGLGASCAEMVREELGPKV